MATYRISTPDGATYNVTAPDTATQDEVLAYAQSQHQPNNHDGMSHLTSSNPNPPSVQQFFGDLAAGAVKGASQIGSTILYPLDATGLTGMTNDQRRAQVTGGLQNMGANPNSGAFKTGEIGSEIAGTAGAGGAVARGMAAIPKLARFAPLVESGGFNLGNNATKSVMANTAMRTAGGAVNGATMAGMVDPSQAPTGAVLGGLIPGAGQAAGWAGKAIADSFTAKPAVAQLAAKAKSLGIDIPADRLVDSPILNATSASLRYLPFSGRVATEAKMNGQIKQALSHTFGEDTPNLTVDVMKNAQAKLGAQFDNILKNNSVTVDPQLQQDLVSNLASAQKELAPDQFSRIKSQVDDLLGKSGSGTIDGQAAYNVKKTLDRLGKNIDSSVAFHAREVKKSLMMALDRSLGPQEAANFADLRQQYGNLKSLSPLVQNGAEGDISMARLGNLKGIRDPQVQDIASIASQFARGRESPHGAMQRVAMGSLGAGALGGGLVTGLATPVAAGLTAGRLANMTLNSDALKNLIMSQPTNGTNMLSDLLAQPAVRSLAVQSQSR